MYNEDFPNLPKIDKFFTDEESKLNFEVLTRDRVLAKVQADLNTQEVTLEQYTDDVILKPFRTDVITIPNIMDFFETRCFPETRVNCQQLLEDLGLKYYNPLAIVKKTHGLQLEDYMWIRFEGEDLVYDDIKIRD